MKFSDIGFVVEESCGILLYCKKQVKQVLACTSVVAVMIMVVSVDS